MLSDEKRTSCAETPDAFFFSFSSLKKRDWHQTRRDGSFELTDDGNALQSVAHEGKGETARGLNCISGHIVSNILKTEIKY